MIFYEGIVGSRSSNLNLSDSDYDFLTCSSCKKESSYDKNIFPNSSHLLYLDPNCFFNKICLTDYVAHNVQCFFPKEVFIETEVTRYIIENRERILRANSLKLFNSLFFYCNHLSEKGVFSYNYKKRLVYSLLYSNLLLKYTNNDVTFEELFCSKDDWHEYLLSIRTKPKQETEEDFKYFQELFKQLPNLKPKYEKQQNLSYMQQVKSDLQEIMHLNT